MDDRTGKKKGRRKYLDHYALGPDDKYSYTGVHFRFDMPAGLLKRTRIIYIILAAATAAIYVAGGLPDMEGNRILYVMLPYIVTFLPLAFMVIDTVKIAFLPDMFTEKQYDRSVLQMKRSSIAVLAAACLAFIGDIVFIFAQCPVNSRIGEIPFLICCLSVISLDAVLIIMQGKTACGPVNQEMP
jgi:hypothetical protein